MKRWRSPLTARAWAYSAVLVLALAVGLYTVAMAWGWAPAPRLLPLGPWAHSTYPDDPARPSGDPIQDVQR